MATNADKWLLAIKHMIEKTGRGEIKWEQVRPVEFAPPEAPLGMMYRADVNDRAFIVYEFEYRHYHDIDEWSPARDVRLLMVNRKNDILMPIPDTAAHWQLLEAVRHQVAGADDFLERFLAGD